MNDHRSSPLPLLQILLLLLHVGCNNVANAMATAKPKILSFGIAAVDFIATVDHFPEVDEKMRSSSLIVAGGGNAANSACAMGRLSDYCHVDLGTSIGDDPNGSTIIGGLEEFNIGVDYVERIPGGNSPFSYVISTPDNARTIIHQPSTRDMSLEFATTKIPIQDYVAVHFDCRHPQAAMLLAEKCVDLNIPFSLDVERPREGLLELLANARVVICNSSYCDTIILGGKRDKTTALSDKEIADRLKQVIREQAPNAEIAVQTLGSRGSCLVRMTPPTNDNNKDFKNKNNKKKNNKEGQDLGLILDTDEETKTVPKVSQHDGALWCDVWGGCDIVDSTGAGDAFQGGFVAALWSYMAANPELQQQTHDMPVEALAHVMRIATRVAAKKLEKPGAREGLPKSSEDEPLQNEFSSLLSPVLAEKATESPSLFSKIRAGFSFSM